MEILHVAFLAFDLFLIIAFLGISAYISYIYSIWKETSIGFWGLGALVVTIATILHVISVIYSTNNEQAIFYFRLAIVLSFIAYWTFGVSNLFARRSITDIVLIAILTFPLGTIIPHILFEMDLVIIQGLVVEPQTSALTRFDIWNFLYFGLLYLIFARDSQLIYKASVRDSAHYSRKSIAITHLLAWQFFAIATAAIRYISKFTETSWYFGVPFLFLLVPLITLGSRPFDWAREGYEPILLLLVDRYGTPTFSWVQNSDTPLLLEGSTLATINEMLSNLVNESVKRTEIQFDNQTLYTETSNDYLSILLTTGNHQSFRQLLTKIHQILVTEAISTEGYGVRGYELPYELKWLLSQLLPESAIFDIDETNSFRQMLLRSGIKI